ncbi:MAG: hypothetical protein QXZ02_02185 [Candidatus Bathyarchaeia archaeon]
MGKAFKRFFSDSRAITPVLSNLLLTVVAVGAMAIATTATYVITTNMREIMSERFIIEDLWFNNSTIQVYLRNVGKVAIQISAIYINHTSFTPHHFSLEISEHGWLNISYPLVPNSLYYIDIVTTRGTHVAGYYKAP